MRPITKLAPLAALAAGSLLLGACGDSGDSGGTDNAATATTAPSAGSSPTAGSGSGTTAGTAAKVSANDASRSEIAAALTAAGVDNAERWAGEVVEYRAYDSASDEARLREELAKYGPSQETIDAILGALTIP